MGDTMNDTYQESKQATIVPMGYQQLLRVVLVGALVGLVTWGLAHILDTYVFKGIICQGSATMKCESSFNYASSSAMIVAAALGALALAKLQVFRSLLAVIATTVGLWGLVVMVEELSWQVAVLLSVLLFAVAYSVFTWVARIRSFLMTLISMGVLVVATRFILNL